MDKETFLLNFIKTKYQSVGKNPMLIVGTSNYIRQNIPKIYHYYDLYILFYPNSSPLYCISTIGFHRNLSNAPIIAKWSIHREINKAISNSLSAFETPSKKDKINPKINVWQMNWIYRCPKISLKDIMQLDACPQKEVDSQFEMWQKEKTDIQMPKNVIRICG